jgi:hypothetical protein
MTRWQDRTGRAGGSPGSGRRRRGGVPRLAAEQPIHCPALCIPLTLTRAGNNVVLG